MTTQLSTIKPDFDSIVTQLQQILSTKSAWKDKYTSSTGQALIEMIAAVGSLDQYAIESALQEGFLDTAKLDKSVVSATRSLGIRITRRQGATCTVNLERTTPELIQLGDAQKYARLWTVTGTAGITWDTINNYLVFTAASTNGGIIQTIKTVPGVMYNVYFNIASNILTNVRASSTAVGSELLDSVTTAGLNHVTFIATSDVTYVSFYNTGTDPAGYFHLSELSVKLRFNGVTIPAYSQFSANSASGVNLLYNAESIQFTPDDYFQQVTLKEGEIITSEFFGTGDNFQFFVSPEANFQVDNSSIFVNRNNVPLPIVTNGVWNYKSQPAVQDSTYRNGELILTFGTDLYGTLPRSSDLITIGYAVTKGLDGNNIHFIGEKSILNLTSIYDGVQVSDIFEATATSSLLGGTDHTSLDVYRNVSPFLYSSRGSAITKQEIQAECLNYAGVLDAKVYGQRDLSSTDLTYMNMVKLSVVVADDTGNIREWTDPEWATFFKWLEQKSIFGLRFFKDVPTALSINITADVFCKAASDLTRTKSAVIQSIVDMLQPRYGILGYNVYLSDINNAIMNSDSSVQYVRLLSPTADVICEVPSPSNIQLLSIAGGTIPAGSYIYGVCSVVGANKTLVKDPVSITTVGTGTIRINWDTVPGAESYEVYGRTVAGFGLLAIVTAPTTTFDDVSATVPGAAQPVLNTMGVRYPKQGNLTFNMYYTDRPTRTII